MSQVNSATSRLMDRYSASADERETEVYFLDFQEMGDPPRLTKKPLIDLLEYLHDAQSTSQKAFREKDDEEEKNRP